VQKIDLEKHMPTKIDDNFAVILAKCQTTEQKYLIKYKKQLTDCDFMPHAKVAQYRLCGAFPLDNMYDELSQGMHAAGNVNTSALYGFPACPCCGNQYGFSTCGCGGVHCTSADGKLQTCPWCGNQAEYSTGGGNIDVSRTKG
jgi:hypothetical protein